MGLAVVSGTLACAGESADSGLFPDETDNLRHGEADEAHMTTHPCGDNTLAMIEISEEHYAFFCDLGTGVAMGETGRLHDPPVLAEPFDCALEAFLSIAPPELEPPDRLIELCVDTPRQSTHVGDITDSIPTDFSHYCSGSPGEDFQDERCGTNGVFGYYGGDLFTCENSYQCSWWCFAEPIGWHQKSTAGQFGDEGDRGLSVIASCSGSTRARGWWEGNQSYDTTVLSNYWQWHTLVDSGGTALPDHEIRFRGDSYTGAYHRAAGELIDWAWP